MPLLEVERLCKRFGGVRAVHEVSFVLEEASCSGHGPQRLGEDHPLQPHRGRAASRRWSHPARRHRDRRAVAHRVCAAGVARTFQLVRPFPGSPRSKTCWWAGSTAGRARRRRRRRPRRGACSACLGSRRRERARGAAHADRPQAARARPRAGDLAPAPPSSTSSWPASTPWRRRRRWSWCGTFVAAGVTVLMVEHIVWALMDLARRIVVLSAGEKIADGPAGGGGGGSERRRRLLRPAWLLPAPFVTSSATNLAGAERRGSRPDSTGTSP